MLTHIRTLIGIGVPVAAFIATTWLFPSKAECQTEQGCEIGDTETVIDEEDGSVWLCISEFECPTRKGRDVCILIAY